MQEICRDINLHGKNKKQNLKRAMLEYIENNYCDNAMSLEQLADETYVITEKGREQEEVTRDSIAFPVMQRAKAAVDQYNAKTRRSEFVKSEVVEQEDGSCAVRMYLSDDVGSLMKLELTAPSKTQGRVLQRAFEQKAEIIYNSVMKQLLQQEK